MRREHATLACLARQTGTAWQTGWRTVEPILQVAADEDSLFAQVDSLGVDGHVWHHGDQHERDSKFITAMTDVTRHHDPKTGERRVKGRLLDLVEVRSGPVVGAWRQERGQQWRQAVNARDPRTPSTTAWRTPPPSSTRSTSSNLQGQMVTEVHCRTQQETLGRRGRKGDPLYSIRNALLAGEEHLSDRQIDRIESAINTDDRHMPVYRARGTAQAIRSIFHLPAKEAKEMANHLLEWTHKSAIPEIKLIGMTLRRWCKPLLAYFETDGANNGGSEAVNNLIELHRRLARGIPTRAYYRL